MSHQYYSIYHTKLSTDSIENTSHVTQRCFPNSSVLFDFDAKNNIWRENIILLHLQCCDILLISINDIRYHNHKINTKYVVAYRHSQYP